MNKFSYVIASVTIALGLMVGLASCQKTIDGQPELVKGKFEVPIDGEPISRDWAARGYANPVPTSLEKGFREGDHSHSDSALIALDFGGMEYVIEGKQFVMKPGDELFYPANATISERNTYSGMSRIWMAFKR